MANFIPSHQRSGVRTIIREYDGDRMKERVVFMDCTFARRKVTRTVLADKANNYRGHGTWGKDKVSVVYEVTWKQCADQNAWPRRMTDAEWVEHCEKTCPQSIQTLTRKFGWTHSFENLSRLPWVIVGVKEHFRGEHEIWD